MLVPLANAATSPMVARGYPTVVLGDAAQEPSQAEGTVSAPAEAGKLLAVTVTNEFIDKRNADEANSATAIHQRNTERWKGLSGAGVWTNDNTVVGVIDSVSPVEHKKLLATPVQAFIRKDWFTKALVGDKAFLAWCERRQQAEARVEGLLYDDVVRETIARHLSIPPNSTPAQVCGELFTRCAAQVMEALNQADQALFKPDAAIPSAAWNILVDLAPYAIDWDSHVRAQIGEGAQVIDLDYSQFSIAESILAGIDGRGCQFEPLKENLYGRWWIRWPAALQGAVPNTPENAQDALCQTLTSQVGNPGLRRAYEQLIRHTQIQPTRNVTALLGRLNKALEERRSRTLQSEHWSLVVIDDELSDAEAEQAWEAVRDPNKGGLVPSLRRVRLRTTDQDPGSDAATHFNAMAHRNKVL
jgi:hypothetical protein